MRTTRLPKLFTAALTAAVTAAVLVPAMAGAAPAVDRVFDLPNRPHHLAVGPDGNIWITLDGLTDKIARVRPDGTVDRFTSAAIVSPIGIVAGPDGQLWVTEGNAIAHFSPSDPSAARRVDIVGLSPNRIVVGADGALWTGSNDRFVRIATDETVVSRVGRSGTLHLTLSEAATVTVRFERKLPGHRKAGRCVKPRRAPHGRRCVRFVNLGTERRTAVVGANQLAIGGKLGKRTLPVSAYCLTIVVTDVARNASRPLTRRLQVIPRPRRPR